MHWTTDFAGAEAKKLKSISAHASKGGLAHRRAVDNGFKRGFQSNDGKISAGV